MINVVFGTVKPVKVFLMLAEIVECQARLGEVA